MGAVVDLAALLEGTNWHSRDPDTPFEVDDDPAVAGRQFWGAVLWIALHDRADSIHFHAWKGGTELTVVVGTTLYHMIPPPLNESPHIAAAARAFLGPERFGTLRRLLGLGPAACRAGEVILVRPGEHSEWHLACWSTQEALGVEFFRDRPFPPLLAE
jgi:hypothetical protein